MVSRLTDTAVRALKPGRKVIKVSDGNGLQLHVQTSGAKTWRYAYRHDGKQKGVALGAYPAIGLAEARQRRDRCRAALQNGKDPAVLLREEKHKAKPAPKPTFKAVATRWHAARKGGWTEGYAERVWARVDGDLCGAFGAVAIEAVDSQQVLDALRKIEARGAVEMAKRVKQYADDIFKFARAERLVPSNPVEELHRALAKNPPKKRRKALKPSEVPELLARLEEYDGEALTRIAVRLTLLTFVRTSEIRFAEWSEFEDLGGPQPLWRISAERMKMRNEHLVPLARQTVALLEELRARRIPGPLLFPAATNSRVMSENTMLFALYRMGFHGRATIHGFRSTASTVLNENDFNRDWVERQLAHVEQDEVRRSYNSAEWLPQRRKMMQWWADWLDARQARRVGRRPSLVLLDGAR